MEFGATFPADSEASELGEQGEGLLPTWRSLPGPSMFGAPLRETTGRIRRLRSARLLGPERLGSES
ncbi:hypothetical protein GCM10018987_11510 [Streptomyces cremeus]